VGGWGRWKLGDGDTYATEEVILEVELQVGVLLDGAEDLIELLALIEDNQRT
jgi:hypothetical protein